MTSTSSSSVFLLTAIYGPCLDREKLPFLDAIDSAVGMVSDPWIVVGDFNMYHSKHEKLRGRINWAMMDMFNAWIRDHGLDEIEISNRQFTWSNKRDNPTLVRLDRVLVNTDWLLGFAQTSASAVPTVTSDHVPIPVQFSNQITKSNPFRMENHWLAMEDTRRIILEGWTRGTRQFQSSASLINFKIRHIRAALRRWKKHRASLEFLIHNNKHVVEYLNVVEERRLLSTLEKVLRQFASTKVGQLVLWKTGMWRRRAKLRWCVSGDESNKFFHAAANDHARRNKIRVFVHEGVEFFNNAQKLQLATKYFSELLGETAPSLPTV
ncbi:uncharacterized protein [Triticum aestivum]|uniref:uncharacterized protein isoform X1 n=1 Tax=Triticum aestivum TaxID=4565 RepID=UPI001D01CF1D|nr:uncharacterized protein LOC123098651 isoform X1 [Triticum aestivum]